MKAILSNYKQSPRKVRLIANLVRGKSIGEAETELRFMVKRAAAPLEKLLASAVANAVNQSGIDKANLVIKEIRVDKGVVLARSMPRAFGRASRINKRSSHVVIVLGEKGEMKTQKKAPKTKAVEVTPVKVKKTITKKAPKTPKQSK